MPPEDKDLIDSLNSSRDPLAQAMIKVMSDVSDMTQKTNTIYRVITGDKEFKIKGLVDFIEEHDKQLAKHNKLIWIGTGVFSVLAVLAPFAKDALIAWFSAGRPHP